MTHLPQTWHACISQMGLDRMSEREMIMYGSTLLATVVFLWRWLVPSRQQLRHIPALTPTAPILYYWGVIQWITRGSDITLEGYRKYKGRPFKVPEFNRWLVVVSGPKLIDDIRKAGDDELSFIDAANQSLEIPFTAGQNIADNLYHVAVIRGPLTRSISLILSDVRDEIAAAFTDLVPQTNEWTTLPAQNVIMQVVSRATNRVFIGLPKCRDPDYINLSVQYTVDVVIGSNIISNFPSFLKPFVARFFTKVPSCVARGIKHLGPIIEERLQAFAEHGREYPNKPNDMLSWLIDEAKDDERTVRNLVLRVLVLNFAAIHTSTNSFMHALYHLAANPEFAKPLRDEVEKVVRTEGWTKAGLDKMYRVDSFLRECQRFYALGGVSMVRKAMKDFTFSDGTFIPKGAFVGTAILSTHHDEEYYDNPDVFNPWRFSDLRSQEGNDSPRHLMVSTSVEYHPFGHGRHACPGRFFAAAELKTVLAYLVTHYDVKMENEGVVPPTSQFGRNLMPNSKAKVLFRKRQ